MTKHTKKFLTISFLLLFTIGVIMFVMTSIEVNQRSRQAVSEVGTIYMSEVSRQIQQKFNAMIRLQIIEMNGIIDAYPPEEMEYGEDMITKLARGARVRNFKSLGLYTQDGEGETLYGEDFMPSDEDMFLNVIENPDLRLCSGVDENGESMLLFVTEVEYPMADGQTSHVMVTGLSMDYLNTVLVLNDEKSLVYSNIIHKNGTFVMQNGEDGKDYFSHITEMFSEIDGKTSNQYAQELQNAINRNEEYSATVKMDDSYQHILCVPLPMSEWYLVCVMPFGVLDDTMDTMVNQNQMIITSTFLVILLGLLLIFVLYYKMSQRQMTELHEMQKEAERANRAKSEFLSNMSHDIRTPMNGIVGMTAIAMANIDDPARVKDCLSKITSSSRHLLGLINDVLDMSKIESGKLTLNMSQVSLRDIMDGIVTIIQPQVKARQQHFDIFIHDIEVEEVYCDSVRLNQVLINLSSNALKFTPEGGQIHIYLNQEPSPLGDQYVRCHFRVKDNGIGMTEEFQREIFDKFARENKPQVDQIEGAGLGMPITKAIVDAMNGTIELQSAPGQGTEFHIVLDLEKATVAEEDMVLPAWNMLVVDNNEDLCRGAVSALKEIGIEADWALNGKTAVSMVQKHHEENHDYEIVLLDWKMPEMDGIETARAIRKYLGDEVPILIISAYDWSDIEEEAKKAGIHGFISKPLFKSNLYLGLSQYMVTQEAIEPESEEEDTDVFAGMRILLAEDNDLNWEIAETLLQEAGFELERAENGQICVEKFGRSDVGYYDLVLMDIRMPVMNGYDAAVAIRAMEREDADLPIIAMTADAFSEDVQHCLECGMNGHIAKPINIKNLLQILKKHLK